MSYEKTAESVVDAALKANEKVLNKSLKEAIINARLTGYGFLMIKRASRGDNYIIQSARWHEVDDALRELGVKGAIGG
jgi:hypothetical protein